MFNLVYRDGSPSNTGFYKEFNTDGVSEYKVGQAVSMSTVAPAKVTLCGGEANANKVYGVVASHAAAGEKKVLINVVSPDMFFEAPFEGTDEQKSWRVPGDKMAISAADYGSVIAAPTLTGDHFGVVLIENRGDKVLVKFMTDVA